jgi:hypothetical protein
MGVADDVKQGVGDLQSKARTKNKESHRPKRAPLGSEKGIVFSGLQACVRVAEDEEYSLTDGLCVFPL